MDKHQKIHEEALALNRANRARYEAMSEEEKNTLDKKCDEIWKQLKAGDEKRRKEWEALPEDERKRRRSKIDRGFAERLSANTFVYDPEDPNDTPGDGIDDGCDVFDYL